MKKAYSLTEAKARFSEIMDRLIKEKEIIVIRKNGDNAAVLVPYKRFIEMCSKEKDGLLSAVGALAGYEDEVDEMLRIIMEARANSKSREVKF